jgi:hypothetical protein
MRRDAAFQGGGDVRGTSGSRRITTGSRPIASGPSGAASASGRSSGRPSDSPEPSGGSTYIRTRWDQACDDARDYCRALRMVSVGRSMGSMGSAHSAPSI